MLLRLPSLLLCALALLAPAVLRATTVVPPSFPELVGDAEAIYRGRVSAVESRRVERADGQGLVIKTFVTVAIERTLKGPEQKEIVLEFLGGTVGDETLTVQGMPRFKVGQRDFVFVRRNGVQFCPLVAMMHGRYRVQLDQGSGREFVARDNGLPLTSPADVELPMAELPAPLRAAATAGGAAQGLSPAAFEASILAEVQRPTPRARLN